MSSTCIADIMERVVRSERLTPEDGVRLYGTSDVETLYRAADHVRQVRHGRRAYYVVNTHLNYSNICQDSCMFCAFARKRNDADAYEMGLEEILARAAVVAQAPPAEVHIVGGLHPDLPYAWYLDMIRGLRQLYPDLHIKAFTAVEIDYLARLGDRNWEQVLRDVREAGVDSLPGGGAEVLSDRVRRKLCPGKIGADDWLTIHRLAHGLGLRSNATMLFGHIETHEERVEHLVRLRDLQDETGGFMAFIPLRFHPEHTRLRKLPMADSAEVLRNIAVARLMLDNFDHIKAYWIQVGLETACRALMCGADDMDGTVRDERITHSAGARTPVGLTDGELGRLIREAGCTPVRRDSWYNEVEVVTTS